MSFVLYSHSDEMVLVRQTNQLLLNEVYVLEDLAIIFVFNKAMCLLFMAAAVLFQNYINIVENYAFRFSLFC